MTIDLCLNKDNNDDSQDLPKCEDCTGYLTNCPYYIPRATDTEPYRHGLPEWMLDNGD